MLEKIDLNGTWELHPVAEFSSLWSSEAAPKEGWVTQEIPAQWQESGSFPNYAGKMVYRKSFAFSPKSDRVYRLEIGGIFYKYRVYLNNYALGGREGYFYPTHFNITPYLRENNLLILEVESPEAEESSAMLTGVFSGHPAFPENYNPGGIWQPIRILSSGPALIESWNLRTDQLNGNEAILTLTMEIYSTLATEIVVKFRLSPGNFKGAEFTQEYSLTVQKGENIFKHQLELKGVKPWQTWDVGSPNLYRVTLLLEAKEETWDRIDSVFGIRSFELKNLIPYLNGERLLIKGSNYLPPALFLSKLDQEAYGAEIALLKESHQNMVRCYKHIETPGFYQAMDEAGILVWQDFPVNSNYSFSHLTGVFHQLEEMFRSLGNHPAVVLWTICNQSGYEERQERIRPVFRPQLEKLAARLGELDPGRPVIPLSGSQSFFASADTGFNFQFPTEIFKFDQFRQGLRKRFIRFVSWFGRSSFNPEEQDEDQQILVRTDYLPTSWKQCKTQEELKALSQREQGEALRFYIDRLRFHKYRPTGGMLLFCFRDLIPGAFWSVVDCRGTPKESFKMVALCYRPVYVFALLPREYYRERTVLQFPICFSNDRKGPDLPVIPVKARLTDPRGQLVWKGQWTVTPLSDEETRVLGEVSVMLMMKGVYNLNLTWEDKGENIENIYQIKSEES